MDKRSNVEALLAKAQQPGADALRLPPARAKLEVIQKGEWSDCRNEVTQVATAQRERTDIPTQWTAIEKPRRGWAVTPNLLDYEQTRTS